MRLTTWNCNRGEPALKMAAVTPLRPDVLVVQECGQLELPGDCYHWDGEYSKQGVLIRTFGSYRLAPTPVRANVPPFILPIQIVGPERLLLFAVWAKKTAGQEYVRGLNTAIEIYSDLITSQPSVVIGDYNSNAIWDGEHPKMRNHSALVQRLEALGLESSYHAHFSEKQGAETRPTYYHHWNESKPFHID
jgi:exodeoxyribonuclease-3